METYTITTALVKHKDKFLIGKRSSNKVFYPNHWEFISGFVEEKKTAEEIILKELMEEVNLTGKIIKSAEPYTEIIQKNVRWITIPFLIEVSSNKFSINRRDHSQIKWVTSQELRSYPDLKTDISNFKRLGLLK